MGAKLRVVRRRIKSVQSTMKITRAMELIAASRILKAQERVESARPYATQLTRAMEDLAKQTGGLSHPLLDEREHPAHIGVLLVTSDRGLAGSYNTNVIRLAEQMMKQVRARGLDPVLYVIGKKGQSYFRFRGVPMRGQWQGVSEVPTYEAAVEIGGMLIADFGESTIDGLTCVYTEFTSAFKQRAKDSPFLPISRAEVEGEKGHPHAEYVFEPGPEQILDELLPQYLITKVYSAMLESAASENAARRRAMKAATENAEDLIKVLTRQANQARQTEITTEIMEIVGGAEALKST
jgi:F-type H+-transporting ATPase subunit gamma